MSPKTTPSAASVATPALLPWCDLGSPCSSSARRGGSVESSGEPPRFIRGRPYPLDAIHAHQPLLVLGLYAYDHLYVLLQARSPQLAPAQSVHLEDAARVVHLDLHPDPPQFHFHHPDRDVR